MVFAAAASCLTLFAMTSSEAAGGARPAQAAVASAHPLATRAGLEILAQGGNAFDAAVAVATTLAVVQPAGSGLGGGGFWLLHRAGDPRDLMLDGRERAPRAAHARMFLDPRGNPVPGLSIDGPLAAAIPGAPAAITHLARAFGRLPLKTTLAPAIQLAEQGFTVGPKYCRAVGLREQAIRRWASTAGGLLDDGRIPQPGYRLIQKDLAWTLRQIAAKGRAGFYGGEAASRLVRGVRASGGIWTERDLADYRIIERPALNYRYGSLRISTAPPPGGGPVMAEALNVLAGFDLDRYSSDTRAHLVIEAMRRAYHDRALYLGDPDRVAIPLRRLLNPDYAAGLRASLHPDRATPSAEFVTTPPPEADGGNTTHYSVLDREGNYVAATLSINYAFGSGFIAPGTGVLLNDEMDDFSIRPGLPNLYGLVGGDANAIAPGKRMLSSMTPTFLDDGSRLAILGTPGGSRIISMVLLATLDFARGASAPAIVANGRYHHQYLPDRVEVEPGALSDEEAASLRRYGHTLEPLSAPYGDMHLLIWDRTDGAVSAASDPRGEGLAATLPDDPVTPNVRPANATGAIAQ